MYVHKNISFLQVSMRDGGRREIEKCLKISALFRSGGLCTIVWRNNTKVTSCSQYFTFHKYCEKSYKYAYIRRCKMHIAFIASQHMYRQVFRNPQHCTLVVHKINLSPNCQTLGMCNVSRTRGGQLRVQGGRELPDSSDSSDRHSPKVRQGHQNLWLYSAVRRT